MNGSSASLARMSDDGIKRKPDGLTRVDSGLWIVSLVLLALSAVVGIWLVHLVSSNAHQVQFGYIFPINIFGIDDGYRFFLARSAWHDPGLYSWSYDLPVAVLLDGILVTIVQGSLEWARIAHLAVMFLSLWLLYLSGRRLGVRRGLMTFSLLLLAFMPLYGFVFISFYGESWLCLLLILAMWAYLTERHTVCGIVLGLLPLIRPEGLFVVIVLGLFNLKHRRVWPIVLSLLPGFLYLLYLLVRLDDFADFNGWRAEFGQIQLASFSPYLYDITIYLTLFNPLWLLLALAGGRLAPMRRLMPFFLAVGVVASYFVAAALFKRAYCEPRYIVLLSPLLVLSSACLAERALSLNPKAAMILVVTLVMGLFAIENIMQNDPVRARFSDGRRWPVSGPAPLKADLLDVSPETFVARTRALEAIYSGLQHLANVDTLIIGDYSLFYVLDPERIPAGVKVIYSAADDALSVRALGGSIFGMYPGGRGFAYYTVWSRVTSFKHTALYASMLPAACPPCRALFKEAQYQVYWLGYTSSDQPNVRPVPYSTTLSP